MNNNNPLFHGMLLGNLIIIGILIVIIAAMATILSIVERRENMEISWLTISLGVIGETILIGFWLTYYNIYSDF